MSGHGRRLVAGALLLGPVGLAAIPGPGVAPCAAQTVLPDSLTFEAAVQVALEHNPAFLRQQNAIDAAEQGERASLGRMLPDLSASLSFNGNNSKVKTAEDDYGRPIGGTDFVETTRSSAFQGLNGSVPLINLQNIRAYGAARAQTVVREAAADRGAAELRTTVGTAYFQAVQRRRLIGVEQRGLETARQQLAAVNELLRMAARQPTDVLGAELQVAQAEQSLRRAQGEARKAMFTLRETLGVPITTSFELASDFPDRFDPSALDAAALVERALRQSPRMAEQEASVEAAERQLSVSRAARYPTLNGSYNWGRSTSLQEYAAFGELNPPNRSWGFGLSIGLPLFNRFQTSAEIGRAEVEADNARASQREVRLALEREVRAALIDLEDADAEVQLSERSVEIARERLRQGQEQYRLGTLDYTALQQMIDQVTAYERGLINAYYQFSVALLQLEEKVGGPIGG